MKCAKASGKPLHHLTRDDRIVCGQALTDYEVVNVVGITPVCSACSERMNRAFTLYHTKSVPSIGLKLRLARKTGESCKLGLGYTVVRRVTSHDGTVYEKSTGSFYRSTDPSLHPNDFEQACEEIECIAANLHE